MRIRNQSRIYSIIFILTLFSVCCKKECKFKNLPAENCGDGYSIASREFKKSGSLQEPPNSDVFIINNDSTYKNKFCFDPDSMPFGYIDFSIKSLITVNIQTNMGSSYEMQGYLCKNLSIEEWKFTIEYSLRDQCEGSGISTHLLTASIITDKISDTAVVNLNLIDVNPF